MVAPELLEKDPPELEGLENELLELLELLLSNDLDGVDLSMRELFTGALDRELFIGALDRNVLLERFMVEELSDRRFTLEELLLPPFALKSERTVAPLFLTLELFLDEEKSVPLEEAFTLPLLLIVDPVTEFLEFSLDALFLEPALPRD